jgi:cold shock CspA family protein
MVDKVKAAIVNDPNPKPTEAKRSAGEELVAQLDMRLAVQRMRGFLTEPDVCDTCSPNKVKTPEPYVEPDHERAVFDYADDSEAACADRVDLSVARVPTEARRLHSRLHRHPLGSQAFNVISIGDPASPRAVPDGFVSADEDGEWLLAIVRRFNRPQGVGYLSLASDSPDILVHLETLRRFGFDSLRCGQYVEIRYGEIDGCWIVIDMR